MDAELEKLGLTKDDVAKAREIAKNIVRDGGSQHDVSAEDKMLMRKVKAMIKKRPGTRPMIAGIRFSTGAANEILQASTMIEEEPLTEHYLQFIDDKYKGR